MYRKTYIMTFPVNPNDQTNYTFVDIDEKRCDFWFDKTFSLSESESSSFDKYDISKNLHGVYEVTVNAKVWDDIHGNYFNGVRVVLCTIKNDKVFFMQSEEDFDVIRYSTIRDDNDLALWHLFFKSEDFSYNRTGCEGLALKIELGPDDVFSIIEGSIDSTVTVRIQMRFNRLVKAKNVDRMLQDIQNVIEEYNDQPGNKYNQETYQKLIVENLV